MKIVEAIDEHIYKLDEPICSTIIDFNHWQKSIHIHLIKEFKNRLQFEDKLQTSHWRCCGQIKTSNTSNNAYWFWLVKNFRRGFAIWFHNFLKR